MAINFSLLLRFLSRCSELAASPGMDGSVVSCYSGVLEPQATIFVAAQKELVLAESANAKAQKDANAALRLLDRPYRVARSVMMAFVPTVKLPSTLKALGTDTDKLNAIEGLLEVFSAHASESWADAQLKGEFGIRSSAAIKALGELITANRDLDLAQKARASAYGPAYDAYLRFKRVVRDACGAKSKDYKRIHMRVSSVAVSEAEAPSATEAPSEG